MTIGNDRIAVITVLAIAISSACGGRSPLDLPFPVAHTSTTALDFGVSECGGTGNTLTVALSNDATAPPLAWTATVTGPFEIVGTTTGWVDGAAAATIRARPLPIVADHARDVLTGNLHLETNDPEHPMFDIPLQVTASGGELTYADTLDFGEVPFSQHAMGVDFRNVGDVPIDVTLGDPTDDAFIHTKGVLPTMTVKPGTLRPHEYAFRPIKPGPQSASVAISVSGPLCGPGPRPLTLRGSGVVGDARLSATQLDFGLVNCGTQAGPKTVELSNVGNAPFTFVTTIGKGFSVLPVNGSIEANGKVTLEVTPAPATPPVPVFANSLGATLSVQTSLPSDPPHVVDLLETPRGAVLALPVDVDLGRVAPDKPGSKAISVINTGNAPIDLLGSVSLGSKGDFWLSGIVPANAQPTLVQLGSHVGVDGVGVDFQSLVPLVPRNQTYLCNAPQFSARMRGFGRAVNASANAQLTCATAWGYEDVYCSGTNDVLLSGFAQVQTGTFALDRVGPVSGWDVAVGTNSVCVLSTGAWYCGFKEGPTTYGATLDPLDPAWMTVGTPFVACVGTSVGLRCAGRNPNGAWGTGSLAPTLALTPTIAMTGIVPTHFAASSTAGYAVLNGSIFVAGTKSGGNLGTSSVPDGLVLSPVPVDGLSDAKSVSAFEGGACALRTTGAVSCWDTTHPTPTDRGAFVDALEVAASGYDDVCVRRQTGVVSCWNGSSVANVAGLHGPAQRLIGQGAVKLVIDTERAVARLGAPLVWMNGFEGP